MKRTFIIFLIAVFHFACNKDELDLNNPDPELFARQLKNGTYDKYEFGEKGDKLWTIMPVFKKEHIPLLIDLAKDTSLICPCDHFPANPISSIPPYRNLEGNTCIMMAEYLLWCVEGIIQGQTFPSLTPVLRDLEKDPDERLTGNEILFINSLYQDWWERYKKVEHPERAPLEDTSYRWQ